MAASPPAQRAGTPEYYTMLNLNLESLAKCSFFRSRAALTLLVSAAVSYSSRMTKTTLAVARPIDSACVTPAFLSLVTTPRIHSPSRTWRKSRTTIR